MNRGFRPPVLPATTLPPQVALRQSPVLHPKPFTFNCTLGQEPLKPLKEDTPMQILETKKPSSSADWRQRLAELEAEATATEQTLTETRTERCTGSITVYGGPCDALASLDAKERQLAERLDTLNAAVALTKSEVEEAEAAERRVRDKQLTRRKAQLAAQILEHAATADAAFATAAENLRLVESLVREFGSVNGAVHYRSLRGCATRAAWYAGLRSFVEAGFVGSQMHFRPLAEQLRDLVPVYDKLPNLA
jgi:hypothetical protein